MEHQVFKDAVFVGGQRQRLFSQRGVLAIEVQQQRASRDGGLNEAAGTPQQGVEPRFQFFELEGFDHVVVSAGRQPFDLVLPIAARGQDQNRKRLAHGAQLPNQVQPTDARQAQIDHGQVVIELRDLIQRFLSVGHRFHHMSRFGQTGSQVVAQQRFILNYQQLHAALPGTIAASRQRMKRHRRISTQQAGADGHVLCHIIAAQHDFAADRHTIVSPCQGAVNRR